MKSRNNILRVAVIAFFIFTKNAVADWEIIGRWPYGPCKAVSVDSNYAYIGTGGIIKVIDISDSSHPTEVTSISTNGVVENLFKTGDYLYVANRDYGLRIFDTRNPSNLIEVGSFLVLGHAEDVHVEGKYAYVVGTSGCGMYILDISDPSDPIEISHSDQWGYSVFVSGNYAYLGNGNFVIVDISDPSNPVAISWLQWRLSEWIDVGEVYVKGDYAYLALWGQGLYVVNISDPSNLVVESRLYPTDWMWAVCGHDNFVYTVACGVGLSILDINDPANPIEIGSCLADYVNDISGLFVIGNYAYIADSYRGLITVAIQEPSAPAKLSIFPTTGYVNNIVVCDDYAYIANGDFSIVNVSDPSNPLTVGGIDILDNRRDHGDATGVHVSGNYAYVVGFGGRLNVIDISDPSHPILLGGYNTFDDIAGGGVYYSDNYAYVAGEGGGLCIIDVSDPSHPTQIGNIITSAGTWDVHVSGMYAYVTDANDGKLYIIDVSTPSDPWIVSNLQLQEHAVKVFVSGNYAYATSWEDEGDNRLHIIDISEKTEPLEASYYNFPLISDIFVKGGYAFASSEVYGISILDVSDPYNPTKIDSIKSGIGYAYSLFLTEENTYVIDNNYGVYILDTGVTNIDRQDKETQPQRFALFQNYPNPFNPTTTIKYNLHESSNVVIKIYNLVGQEIETLVNGFQKAGEKQVQWTAEKLPSALYFCRLKVGEFSDTKKLILHK